MSIRPSIKQKINIGLGLALVVLIAVGIISYRSLDRLRDTNRWVTHTHAVLEHLSGLVALVNDAQRGERGYVITGDAAFLVPYRHARQRIAQTLETLGRLTADNASQQERLARLDVLIDSSFARLQEVITLRGQGFEAARAVVQTGEIRSLVERIEALVAEMREEEVVLLQVRRAAVEQRADLALAVVLFGSLLGVLFLAVAGVIINRDIDERRRVEHALRESRERFRSLIETAGSAILAFDPEGRVLEFNQEAERVYGRLRAEVVGRPYDEVFAEQPAREAFRARIARALEGQPARELDLPVVGREGDRHILLWNVNRLTDLQGVPNGVIAVGKEITQRKRMEEQLQHDATHDALTGLQNRAAFTRRLDDLLAEGDGAAPKAAVCFLDLDRFKLVNDSLGHQVGDQLLIGTAHRLLGCLRASDTLARLGGDEFAILLRGLEREADAQEVARRIHEALATPFHLDGQEVYTSASIGIVCGLEHYTHPADVLRDADTAMYRAKGEGHARQVVFEPGMHQQTLSRISLEAELRRGLEREEFVVFYQPIVRLTDGSVQGFEALVRWRHPGRGLVSPAEFIPLAEETGLILPLGEWVLQAACRQMHAWHQHYSDDLLLILSVNFSREQFLQPHAIERVAEILTHCGLNPASLILEVTERVLEKDAARVIKEMPFFKSLGVQLCLDDFGTGFSSLSALNELPVNTLKIDRSFVWQMDRDRFGHQMLQAIVSLAHTLEKQVVAEGIETPEQLRALRALGCEYGQGFLFSRPVDAETAEAMMTGGAAWQEHFREEA